MPLRYYALIGSYLTCLLLGAYGMRVHDNVTALKLAEIQKSAVIANMQIVNSKLHNELILSENINKNTIEERNIITQEYQLANENITKYQKIINSRSHIDYDSWVRILNNSNTTAAMQQITTNAIGIISTNESNIPASVVLEYTVKMKEDRDNCAIIHNQTINWYTQLRNIINK